MARRVTTEWYVGEMEDRGSEKKEDWNVRSFVLSDFYRCCVRSGGRIWVNVVLDIASVL